MSDNMSTAVLAERLASIEREVQDLKAVVRREIKGLRDYIQGNGNEGLKAMTLMNRASIQRLWAIVIVILTAVVGGLLKFLLS